MEFPRDDVIRAELRKLLESAVFANSARLNSFLTFVVDRTLTGDGEHLKETTIGVEVYGRKVGYDPRNEPIVRTEARRLRLKLEEYYQGVGSNDRVRILLPKGRYAPAFEFREELEQPAIAPPSKPPTGGRRWLFLGIGLTIILVIGSWWWQTRKQPTQALAPPTIRPLTSYTGTEFQPAFAPDGKHFAFVWDGGIGNFDIYTKLVNIGEPIRLTSGAGVDLFPAWSPRGDFLAFLRVTGSSQGLYTVPATGGNERKIADLNLPELAGENDPSLVLHKPGPAWSHDGESLVVSVTSPGGGTNVLYQFAVDGSGGRRLTSPPRRRRQETLALHFPPMVARWPSSAARVCAETPPFVWWKTAARSHASSTRKIKASRTWPGCQTSASSSLRTAPAPTHSGSSLLIMASTNRRQRFLSLAPDPACDSSHIQQPPAVSRSKSPGAMKTSGEPD